MQPPVPPVAINPPAPQYIPTQQGWHSSAGRRRLGNLDGNTIAVGQVPVRIIEHQMRRLLKIAGDAADAEHPTRHFQQPVRDANIIGIPRV